SDVAEANRGTVLVSDNDGLIRVRGKNLIVRSDGERLARPVEAPFRRIDIRLPKNCAHIVKAESERGDRRRVHLDAHGGLLIALNRDQTDAGYFAQLLREERVRKIVHAIERQAVRGDRQGKDRRIGGVDLVVFGRVRQVLRQKSAGNIDRWLFI